MNYPLIVYILFAIMLIFGGIYLMISLQKTVGAMLYLIGSICLCVFYGLRWFNKGDTKSIGYSGPWPPTVNMCPDYFSLYTDTASNKQYCVDYVGFSSKIKKFKNGDTIVPVSVSGNTPDFKLGASGGSANAIPTTFKTAEKCFICQGAGLTWEGVYDGNSCSTYIGAPGTIGSGGCPPQ